MLWKKGVLPCAAMQARCCCDSGALVAWEGCALSMLSCMQSCCHDHRMLWWKKGGYPALPCNSLLLRSQVLWCKEGCAIPMLSCMQAAVMIHRMLWWKKGVLSLRCHAKLAAVVIHRMPAARKVCYPAVMQARCCHDPQNALVEEGVPSLRCHASSCCDSQMLWCKLLS
jgi:hypothetical protein